MRRRIPWWAAILAFAVLAGGGLAGLAYLRARTHAQDAAAFCEARKPDPARLAAARIELVERDSRHGKTWCQLYYRRRGAREDIPAPLFVSTYRGDYERKLRELATLLHDEPAAFTEGAVRGAYVTKREGTREVRWIVMAKLPGGEVLEVQLDPDVFALRDGLQIAADIAARPR